MKRILVFILGIGFSSALAWLAGYDFDTRGPWEAYAALCAAFLSGLASAHPDLK